MAIRTTLAAALNARQLSLTALSDKVGISMANLSALKNNRCKALRFSTLNALCRELGCQPGDLLHHDPDLSG